MMLAFWYSFLVPLGGVMIIGFLSGILGTFAFLKKQTMLGDVIAHAALPGIVGAFILTHNSSLAVLMSGGLCAGLCAVFTITMLSRYTTLPIDALFGIILSVFFGAGLALLTYVQTLPIASQSVLNKFLFGSAATLVLSDLIVLLVLCIFICMLLYVVWKPCVMVIADPLFARNAGISVATVQLILQIMMVTVIVAGLYAVGVVLMSSLLVAPAVMARQVTRSVNAMAFVASTWGVISCVMGMMISAAIPHMPTGAVIVVIATVGAWIALCVRRFQEVNIL